MGQHDPSTMREVARCASRGAAVLGALLEPFRLRVVEVPGGAPIPGTHWGEPEAGLVGDRLHVRADTPLHSALHEACHYVCMDSDRRARLDTDAGGDYDEENAVNYLSILLAGHVEGFGRARMLDDMDAWGYSFRLGSARAWFEADAADARAWLLGEALIDAGEQPTWRLRGESARPAASPGDPAPARDSR